LASGFFLGLQELAVLGAHDTHKKTNA